MFGEKQQQQNVDDFWREYEEKTGEKVLAKTLGQYLSGWAEFGNPGEAPLWGLVIVTSRSLRFHHFPRQNWLSAMFRPGARSEEREKTFCIPREQITSAEIRRETRWWKKIFPSAMPLLVIQYGGSGGEVRELSIQIEHTSEGLVENLR